MRSRSRNISSPITSQRPERFQSSAGCSAGSLNSWPPIASISARTMPRDLLAHALAERQQRVDARHQLAHVARAHEQLVARGLGVGGVVAQRGNEGFGPAHGAPLARGVERYWNGTPSAGAARVERARGSARTPDPGPPIRSPSRLRTGTRPAPLPVRNASLHANRSKRPSVRSCAGNRELARELEHGAPRDALERAVGRGRRQRARRRARRTRSPPRPRRCCPARSARAPRRRRACRASRLASTLFR